MLGAHPAQVAPKIGVRDPSVVGIGQGIDRLPESLAGCLVDLAVAVKLSGDSKRLQEIKARYGDAMAATTLSSTFGVVTRDGGSSALADSQSLLKLSGEVDMFKGFLDKYKSGEAGKTATP